VIKQPLKSPAEETTFIRGHAQKSAQEQSKPNSEMSEAARMGRRSLRRTL
jgi:hypothetical protein